jgi:hypothetical protein
VKFFLAICFREKKGNFAKKFLSKSVSPFDKKSHPKIQGCPKIKAITSATCLLFAGK